MSASNLTSKIIPISTDRKEAPVGLVEERIYNPEVYEGPSTLKSNDDSAKDVEAGVTEPVESSPSKPDYYAYDIRTDVIFKFRRMNKYVLLQTIPLGAFMKISLEDFDLFFEGTPEPMGPLIQRLR